jgi:NADH dehydrogenase
VRRLIHVTATAARNPAEESTGEWLTIRAPGVYGTIDDPVTLFLIMMRSLPAVPVSTAARAVRPLWHEDLALAAAAAVVLPVSLVNRVVNVHGPDAVTAAQLYERISALIDRRPVRVPVPDFLATHGKRLADALHLPWSFDMAGFLFGEGDAAGTDAAGDQLKDILGVTATGLDDGLTRLIGTLAEVTPSEGIGSLDLKRFSVDIHGAQYGAVELLRIFRARFADLMPIPVGVEPAAAAVQLDLGNVLTLALPGRGHVQIRVEDVTDDHVVVGTLRGHVVAGVVRFRTEPLPDGVRFEVMTCDRAANAIDWIALTLGGARLQDANWTALVQNVGTLAGGSADDVRHDARKLDQQEATAAQDWIGAVIRRHGEDLPTAGA